MTDNIDKKEEDKIEELNQQSTNDLDNENQEFETVTMDVISVPDYSYGNENEQLDANSALRNKQNIRRYVFLSM